MPGPRPRELVELIEAGRVVHEDGCHSFYGRRTGRQPAVGAKHRRRLASRVLLGLADDDPLVARHTCDNNWCINPEHLLPGTQAQNLQDAVDRKRLNFSLINKWEGRERDSRGRWT